MMIIFAMYEGVIILHWHHRPTGWREKFFIWNCISSMWSISFSNSVYEGVILFKNGFRAKSCDSPSQDATFQWSSDFIALTFKLHFTALTPHARSPLRRGTFCSVRSTKWFFFYLKRLKRYYQVKIVFSRRLCPGQISSEHSAPGGASSTRKDFPLSRKKRKEMKKGLRLTDQTVEQAD